MEQKTKKQPVLAKIASHFYHKYSGKPAAESDAFEILNAKEVREIRKIRISTCIIAAVVGALGVILLYVPQYIFESTLNAHIIYLKLYGENIEIPLWTTIYGILLAFLETYVLLVLNLISIHKISKVCGFPDKKDNEYEFHLESLINIGLEAPSKKMLDLGIDPFQGMSKVKLWAFIIFSKLKATLSNVLFKVIVKRILGRYAFRMIVDMAGIPVFAAWNAWASNSVLKDAKVRIMAPGSINVLIEHLYSMHGKNEKFRQHIYDTLLLIAMLKRKFHENHGIMALKLLSKFEIETEKSHKLSDDFLKTLAQENTDIKKGIEKILVLGIIIDGSISFQEYQIVQKMRKLNILSLSFSEIRHIKNNFSKGKGISELLK